MVSRRKLLTLAGGAVAASTIGSTTYCSVRGCSDIRNTVTGSPETSIRWTQKLQRPASGSIPKAAADEDAWYLPARNNLVALDRDTGKTRFSLPFSDEVPGRLRRLYVFGDYLVGISPGGGEVWKSGWAAVSLSEDVDSYYMNGFDDDGMVYGGRSRVAADPPFVVFQSQKALTAYNLETKEQAWQVYQEQNGRIAAGDGTLYQVGYSREREMYGLKTLPIDAADEAGSGISTFNIPGTRNRTLRTYDGRLIIVTAKAAAAITDAGEVAWTYRLPENDRIRGFTGIRGKTRLINGKLFIRGDTYFAVVDASDGTPVWQRTAGNDRFLSDAAATKNGVYVASSEGGSVDNTFGTEMLLRTYAFDTGEKLGHRAFDEDYRLLNSDEGVLLQQTNYDWEFTALTL